MKVLKNICLWASVLILCLAFGFGCATLSIFVGHNLQVGRYDFSSLAGLANKSILFIGDGMGFNHVNVTSKFYEKDMFMQSLDIYGSVTTFSTSLLLPTDSAAAGSALATGQKFNNKEIARHNGKDIENLGEYAKRMGLGAGIVTTDSLSGATPAAFSAHADNRGDSEQIITSQLTSNIDLFLGKGYNSYSGYSVQIEQNGYDFVNDFSQLSFASDKLIGCFQDIPAENGTILNPTLDMLTSFAIDYMEVNFPDGYFLMIEGAHIDKRSHDNEIFEMMQYLNNFDKSIEIAVNRFKDIENSAVFVTADHETGGLRFSGRKKEEINNSLFSQSGHTSQNVPYYMFINTNAQVNVKDVIKSEIDNTDVCKIFQFLLKSDA